MLGDLELQLPDAGEDGLPLVEGVPDQQVGGVGDSDDEVETTRLSWGRLVREQFDDRQGTTVVDLQAHGETRSRPAAPDRLGTCLIISGSLLHKVPQVIEREAEQLQARHPEQPQRGGIGLQHAAWASPGDQHRDAQAIQQIAEQPRRHARPGRRDIWRSPATDLAWVHWGRHAFISVWPAPELLTRSPRTRAADHRLPAWNAGHPPLSVTVHEPTKLGPGSSTEEPAVAGAAANLEGADRYSERAVARVGVSCCCAGRAAPGGLRRAGWP